MEWKQSSVLYWNKTAQKIVVTTFSAIASCNPDYEPVLDKKNMYFVSISENTFNRYWLKCLTGIRVLSNPVKIEENLDIFCSLHLWWKWASYTVEMWFSFFINWCDVCWKGCEIDINLKRHTKLYFIFDFLFLKLFPLTGASGLCPQRKWVSHTSLRQSNTIDSTQLQCSALFCQVSCFFVQCTFGRVQTGLYLFIKSMLCCCNKKMMW